MWDELVVSAWVYWDERRRELELLRRAGRYGLSLSELGRFVGIGTRQGMRDYLDRLESLLHEHRAGSTPRALEATEYEALYEGHGRPPPTHRPPPGVAGSYVGLPRASRDADVHARRRDRARDRARPTQAQWVAQHAVRVTRVVRELLVQASRMGIEAEESDVGEAATLGDYLAWLAEDLDDLEPATVHTLGLALGELRARAEIANAPRNHGMHQALGAADRLRADYADLVSD